MPPPRPLGLGPSLLLLLLLLTATPRPASSHSYGAPLGACDAMKPHHNSLDSQTSSTNPYALELDKTTLTAGQENKVKVTLKKKAADATDFKGFFLQAHEVMDDGTEALLGQFSGFTATSQGRDCLEKPASAATHTSKDLKSEVSLDWSHPGFQTGGDKTIKFYFTVVQEFTTFWVKNAHSETLTLKPGGEVNDYEGCSETKGCFGLPADCVSSGNCKVLVTYKINDDKVDFRLRGTDIADTDYLAVGLGNRAAMAEALVFGCLGVDGGVAPSWNIAESPTNNLPGVTGVTPDNESVANSNGVFTCSFSIPTKFKITAPGESAERSYDLDEDMLHLLLSTGPVTDGGLDYHTARLVSAEKMQLGQSEPASEPEQEQGPLHEDYNGCLETKGCFGSSEDCITKGNCKVMVSYKKNADDESKMDFTLHSTGASAEDYAAVGFGVKSQMAEALVFGCLGESGGVAATWNIVGGTNNIPGVTGVTFENEKTVLKEGVLTCSFTVPSKLKITAPEESSPRDYDLIGSQYTLLVAAGPTEQGQISYHTDKAVSGSKVDLTSFSLVGASGDTLIRVHGICMILAWLASAAGGMLFARYLKESFRPKKVLGLDPWFRVHQASMGAAILLTTIGSICIIIERGFWPYSSTFLTHNLHPIFGLVTIILAFINPIMAAFRPHPGTEYRWYFNWTHWFVGNAAWILGLASIYLAGELGAAGFIPTSNYNTLLFIYAVVHVLVHILLTVQRSWAFKKEEENETIGSTTAFAMTSTRRHSGEDKEADVEPPPAKNLPGSPARVGVAILWFVGAWVFALYLSVLIGAAAPGREVWY